MATPTPKRRGTSRRLTARDWEIGALEVIGERGVAGLAIEPLSRRLGVTKGSFYWHFADPEALLRAALARWERVFTDGKYGELAKRSDPAERLQALFDDVASDDAALGVFHALALAQDHPAVRPVFRRVTRKRLRFLATALEELGLSARAAERRSILLYSAYIGFLQTARSLPTSRLNAAERRRIVAEAFTRLVPEAG